MKRKSNAKIFIALFFIAIPNVNIIDLLPDVISYIIFFRLINTTVVASPYMYETRLTLKRLIYLTAAKIPMSLIMIGNIYTGRDIIPLFTLVFGLLEAILLYSLVSDLFAGLFYIAERTDADAIISPIKVFKKSISSDGIKMLSLFFLITKCILNVIPEFCLLSTSNPKVLHLTTKLYLPLLSSMIVISLTLGIIWYKVAKKYAQRIASEANIAAAINSMLGDKKIEKIKNDLFIEKLIFPMTLIAFSSFFIIDYAFSNTDGINILPHFIYGLILCFAGLKITSSLVLKKVLALSTALYSAFGIAAHALMITFITKYRYVDLPTDSAAREYYTFVEIFTVLETVSFIVLAYVMARILRKYIVENTGVSPRRRSYNKIERDYHRMNIRRSYILFGTASFIHLAKCAKVFLDANVNTIFSQTGVIITSYLPWLGWTITSIGILFIIYSFIYLSGIKTDVRFKYDKEELEIRRGVFE